MFKNVNWEKGFQRLWQVYACLVFCFAIFLRLIDAGYSNPTFSPEWFAILLKADLWAGVTIALWLFVPVVISKAFQWVAKGFKPDNK